MSGGGILKGHEAELRAGRLWNGFLDLLFPPKCPFCRTLIPRPGVCADCAASLPWTDDRDGLRTVDGLSCAAPLRYEGVVRNALLAFKFQGETAAAEPLGRLIAQCAAERFSGQFDAVTYAPISRERRRERGYNQAELLARAACRAWDIRPEAFLVKTRDNPAQSSLANAAERRRNVSGVYAPAPGHDLAGRRLLLVDDICTTGATLSECAKVLRENGAAAVYGVTVAMTAGRNPA